MPLGALRNLLKSLYRRVSGRSETALHLQHVAALARQRYGGSPKTASDDSPPLLSFVIPVFDTDPAYLDQLLKSFAKQSFPACELVLSDDGSTSSGTLRWLAAHKKRPRVRVVGGSENAGIARATNRGLDAATGGWVALLDHDDALAPYAVQRIAEAIATSPNAKFIYTDEVVVDKKLRPVAYFLKPAWDPVLLSGVNYVNHLSLYRRDRLLGIGGLREGFEGSQDYDLLLRYTKDLKNEEILHLPYPAYLWRRDGSSFSAKFMELATTNARRALLEAYGRTNSGIAIEEALLPGLHRLRFDRSGSDRPLVSVIIPSRDGYELISRTLRSLTEMTDYPNLELIVVDNGSKDPLVLNLYDAYRGRSDVQFVALVEAEPFNFSRSVNRGIARANGDLILLLNNDIEVLEPDWLAEMVSCFAYPDTGIVGAKLLYPNRTIQHAGVIAGLGDLAGHWYINEDANFPGPMGRLAVRQSMSVVTGACMLISRKCLDSVGSFDEEDFAIAYNDVDFCLRSVNSGFRVVWTPFATLVHHESASRGSDETAENIGRFRKEQDNLRRKHGTDALQDRAFNPWYSRNRSYPAPVRLERLPEAR